MGHAGSDVESAYRRPAEIAADLARDPLLATARLLVGSGRSPPRRCWRATRTSAPGCARSRRRSPTPAADDRRGGDGADRAAPPGRGGAGGAVAAPPERRLEVFGGELPEEPAR